MMRCRLKFFFCNLFFILAPIGSELVAEPSRQIHYQYSNGETEFNTNFFVSEELARTIPFAVFRQRYVGQLKKTVVNNDMSVKEAGEKRIREMNSVISEIRTNKLAVAEFKNQELDDLKKLAVGESSSASAGETGIWTNNGYKWLVDKVREIDGRFLSDTKAAYVELGRLYPYYVSAQSSDSSGAANFRSAFGAVRTKHFVDGWLKNSPIKTKGDGAASESLKIVRHYVNLCSADLGCLQSSAIAVVMIIYAISPSVSAEVVSILDEVTKSESMTDRARNLIARSPTIKKIKESCPPGALKECPSISELGKSVLPAGWDVAPELKEQTQKIIDTFH